MTGLRWFITGVGSGLGQATAAAALARGDRVAGVLRSTAAGDAFAASAPGRATACIADVSDRAAMFAAIARAEAEMGGIDVLVNNAAQVLEAWVEEADPDAVRALFDINLLGPLHAIQAVLPAMRARRKGRIITISSAGGITGVPSVGLYSASKFALEGMSEALAIEVAPLGIAVTIVEPGAFRTNLLVRGRTTVASSIADYTGTDADRMRSYIAGSGGRESGDPARFATALLAVVDAAEPPLRVALGDDAITMALGKADAIRRDVEAWRGVGSGLGFTG